MQTPVNISNESGLAKGLLHDGTLGSTENALLLQRKQRLQSMVYKRKENLKYLMRTHEGGVFWLNCILLTKDDISQYIYQTVPKHRTLLFFYLAIGASTVLKLPKGSPTVKAFLQLLEEWEYFFAGSTMQSMKFVLAKNSTCVYPSSSNQNNASFSGGTEDSDWTRVPSLSKFDNTIVFEYLHITPVPFELDYIEVLAGLCDSLIALYDKFQCKECYM